MISAHFARVLHRNLMAHGIEEKSLFEHTGLDPTRVWQSSRLQPQEFITLLHNARRLAGEAPIGFLLAGQNRLSGLGMMGVAMLSAPTLGDGLQAMASFSTLQAGYVHLALSATHERTAMQLHLDDIVGETLDMHVESILSLIQEYMEGIIGPFNGAVEFSFAYPARGRQTLYQQYLKGAVRFEQSNNGVSMPSEWLKRRSPYADADLWVMSRRYLSEQLQQAAHGASQPFSDHLRAVLSAKLPPLPDIGEVADSLHLSTRTLNRRLKDEGQTFRQLKLEAVHQHARRMLLEGSSVEAVALALGYDNPANFRRSFRDFVGCSPTEWLGKQSR